MLKKMDFRQINMIVQIEKFIFTYFFYLTYGVTLIKHVANLSTQSSS